MKYVSLGEIANFINGYSFKPSDWGDQGLKIIRIQNLTDRDKPFNKTIKLVPERYFIHKGDLLISWSATLGIFEWKNDEDALLNQHIFKVVLDSNLVEKKYFMYVLKYTIEKMQQFTHGSTMKHIVRGDFLKHEIPLPSLEEQREIIKILDRADSLRQKRKQVIKLLDEYLKSVFLDMFGDPTKTLNKWKVLKLGDLLFSIDSGWSPKCLETRAIKEKWGVLKLSAITDCSYHEDQNKQLPDSLQPKSSIEVKNGDLLFSRKNTYNLIAASAFVFSTRPQLMLSDLIFRLKIIDTSVIKPEFLWKTLTHSGKRKEIQQLAGGAAGSMPNISKEKLKNIDIPIPPIDLQQRFAQIVHDTEVLKNQMFKQSQELDTQFQALMQKSFQETTI